MDSTGPVELSIEATTCDGALADWLDDDWWAAALERWPDESVTVRIEPTYDALLHPVLLYQLEMIRRVAGNWRIVGYAYATDLLGEGAAQQAARSPYHEIRVIDAARAGARQREETDSPAAIEALFGQIRREQIDLGVTQPVLVRLPPTAHTDFAGVRDGT